ncbi:50S ribosomal protein L31 type B [Listeria monocytogenes]|nr:50S ribosomal protein L31 type B [Listeria monocytogenes]GAM95791.1 50S ribosomal protein L31 type B [Listeria monocytogenes]
MLILVLISNFCQVLLRAQAKQLNGKMATSIHYYVSKSLLIRTRSILVNKNMRLQTAVWTASTKNTVSNKTVCNERNNLRTQLLLGVFFYGIISQNY